jgi:hypothetical protein
VKLLIEIGMIPLLAIQALQEEGFKPSLKRQRRKAENEHYV